jgi:ABC-type cobalt transport system substrate-binding protein
MLLERNYHPEKILTKDEVQQIKQRYKNGFHVYFQPIKGDNNEVLFRTSEYIAT